ncbi:nidogen-like domain-containing protein [Paracoccus sp. (in: a-proteobacteria)]|uniref:nidogen-like domain-containing protein n=1 Tax=Paracoccus sp. TaxID=267 RepID=UPI0026E05299|nr:nidogen-like domain-containing protein [Paracoccus sp. (in: a-proteobacteria)]MDO5647481.1 nidogen-like domain-containing protein [Paracoccus sp. (in: a-proteobacteria)]
MRQFLLLSACLALPLLTPQVQAKPVAFVFFEGFDSLAEQREPNVEPPSGLETLNKKLRDTFQGMNYFSRLFQWDQVEQAVNFVNNLGDVAIYTAGFSRGGYAAVRFANQLNDLGARAVERAYLIDPVRCGDEDETSTCYWNAGKSSGDIHLTANVKSAESVYQVRRLMDVWDDLRGGIIAGERNVTWDGSDANINVNAETRYEDDRITHVSLPRDPRLHADMLADMAGYLDNKTLFTNLGGDTGFGTLAMTRNDDGSTQEIQLPFKVDFGGRKTDRIFINNNGNITFDQPYGAYTPEGFASLSTPMIAPFWADVDTRCAECGNVYVAAPAADTFVVTWKDVGFFSQNASKTNTFQLVLRDRYDLTGDAFDIEFRYDDLNWTTGDASGGANGLGGTPAYAGFTGDDRTAPQQLIGSGTAAVLDLQNRNNLPLHLWPVNTGPVLEQAGRFAFAVRGGETPGVSSDNPLMPDSLDGAWVFTYATTRLDQIVWSDPIVTVGYDYETQGDTRFTSFILPENIGGGLYDLWLRDDEGSVLSIALGLMGGIQYQFSQWGRDAVDFFRITGIDPDAGVDPNDTRAFVTGLTFARIGAQNWTQTPLTIDTDPPAIAPVPVPAPVALMLTGLAGLGLIRRRSRHA